MDLGLEVHFEFAGRLYFKERMLRKLLAKFHNLPFFWQKFFYMLYIATVFTFLYTVVGRLHHGDPLKLPLTIIDRQAPFLEWTFWIYVSDYLYLAITGFMMPDYAHLYRFRKAFLAVVAFHLAFFYICPTDIMRPNVDGQEVSHQLGRLVHLIDNKTNCFPSLHVSLTFLAAFFISKMHKWLAVPACLWAIAIAASTLTTRQHYFYDVIGGLIVAIFAFAIFFYRPISTPQKEA